MSTKKPGEQGGRWVTMGGKRLFIQDESPQEKSRRNRQPTRRSGKSGKLAPVDKNNKLRNGDTGKARKSTVQNPTPKKRGKGSKKSK